jgi:hypothetical protein
MKRISSVGWGARETIQIILGRVVADIREGIVQKKYDESDLDELVAFHDRAEALWQASISTNPPIDKHELAKRVQELRATCKSPVLAEFERRLERGMRVAEEFENKNED